MTDGKPCRDCPDCGAEPGTAHEDDCDVAACLRTGMQRIQCGLRPLFDGTRFLGLEHHEPHPGEDCGRDIWTGEWPGNADAIRLGWWCYFEPGNDPSWVRCGPDHPEATPDLSRLIADGRWDRDLLRWEARG